MQPYPILYSFRRCPYAMRARLALYQCGIAYQLREVDLKNKPEAMLTSSPKATVPVLLLDEEKLLEESLDIVDWAFSQNASYLDTDEERACIDNVQSHLAYYVSRHKYPERYDDIDAKTVIEKLQEYAKMVDGLLAGQSYLFTQVFGKAEISMLPFLRQCHAANSNWYDALELPNFKKWFSERISSKTMDFIMQKHPVWVEKEDNGIWINNR